MELVLFDIQENRFALRASAVSQVLESLAVTPLPYAPPEVEGLVNVTGTVLLKIDLALLLNTFLYQTLNLFSNLLKLVERNMVLYPLKITKREW